MGRGGRSKGKSKGKSPPASPSRSPHSIHPVGRIATSTRSNLVLQSSSKPGTPSADTTATAPLAPGTSELSLEAEMERLAVELDAQRDELLAAEGELQRLRQGRAFPFALLVICCCLAAVLYMQLDGDDLSVSTINPHKMF